MYHADLIYHTVKLFLEQLNRPGVLLTALAEYQLTASPQTVLALRQTKAVISSSYIVWGCTLGHCPRGTKLTAATSQMLVKYASNW